MADQPYQERGGGSYVKEPDGTLRRVEGTEQSVQTAADRPPAPARKGK